MFAARTAEYIRCNGGGNRHIDDPAILCVPHICVGCHPPTPRAMSGKRKCITTQVESCTAHSAQPCRCSMSALGQKQTLARLQIMSALPPIADIDQTRS